MREERKRRANQEKLTFKIGYVQKKINTFLKKLPDGERRKFESGEERSRRKKLKEIKETLWKKSRIDGEKLQTGDTAYNLEIQESKLETIEAIYKKCEREEAERIGRREEEKKTQKEKKKRKEERLEIKKKLEEKWAMMR